MFPTLKLSDTIISLIGALSLFVVPMNFKKGTFVLQWNDTSKLAWGILLLFGGGLSLAKGMASSGLVAVITQAIEHGGFIPIIVVSLLIILMLFMTELMSNVALVAVLAPVVAGIAIGLKIPILHVLIPVTMASSCAFMLPVATPPNLIVYGSNLFDINQMMRAGLALNIIGIILVSIIAVKLVPYFLG